MPKLFGLDIAKIVDDSIQSAGGVLTGTFHKRAGTTRDANNLTGGVRPTFTDSTIRGFLERRTDIRIDDTLVTQDGDRVSILGNSLGAIVPEAGDEVTFENERYKITRIRTRDPAAALYVCDVTK